MALGNTQQSNADSTPSESSRQGAQEALEHTLNGGASKEKGGAREAEYDADAVDENLISDVEKQLATSTKGGAPHQKKEPVAEPQQQPATQPIDSDTDAAPASNPQQNEQQEPAPQPKHKAAPEQREPASKEPRENEVAVGDETPAPGAALSPREKQLRAREQVVPEQRDGQQTQQREPVHTEQAAPEKISDLETPQETQEQDPAPGAETTEQYDQVPRTQRKAPPEPTPEEKEHALPRLRTFKNDIAAAMKKQKTSKASIATAEQKRKETRRKATAKRTGTAPTATQTNTGGAWPLKRILVVSGIATAVLLVIGGSGFVAYTFLMPDTSEQQTQVRPYNLITTNQQQEIPILNQRADALRTEIVSEADALPLSLGEVGSLYFVRETNGTRTLTTANGFFEHIAVTLPSPLRRTLLPAFTLGMHSFDGIEPFLLLQITNFETAFAGMLDWEADINADLAPIFGPELDRRIQTATSTQPELRRFTDVVIQNQDVRALENDAGEIALLYAFPRRDTLIITTNADTLNEVLSRLRAKTIVQ